MIYVDTGVPLMPIGRMGSRNMEVYAYLDALEVGETWEIQPHGETERSLNRLRTYWQDMRYGRKIRVHSTSRGFLFVRIE